MIENDTLLANTIKKIGDMECHFLKIWYMYFHIALKPSSNN